MIETAKSGANLSDEEIKEEVDTIMFEVININLWDSLALPNSDTN